MLNVPRVLAFNKMILNIPFSKENEDLSVKAKSRFSISLRSLSQPMSLGEIARTWDVCARTVISEHAQQSGGGSFSSKYGTWENCLTTWRSFPFHANIIFISNSFQNLFLSLDVFLGWGKSNISNSCCCSEII